MLQVDQIATLKRQIGVFLSNLEEAKIEKSRKGLGGVEGEIFMVHRLNAAPFSLSS